MFITVAQLDTDEEVHPDPVQLGAARLPAGDLDRLEESGLLHHFSFNPLIQLLQQMLGPLNPFMELVQVFWYSLQQGTD